MFAALVVYITIVAILAGTNTPRKGVRVLSWLACAAIGILIAFRAPSVGADTENYHRMYHLLASGIIKTDIELGFVWLVYFLNKITSDAQALFIVQGTLVAVSCYHFVTRNTSRVSEAYIAILAFLAFNLFSFHLSGVRQSFAMCICLFAYEKIKQGKLVGFTLTVATACLFHMAALFFFPAYIIAHAKKGKARVLAILGTIAGCFLMERVMSLASMANDRFAKYGVEETDSGYIFFAIVTLITLFEAFNQRNITKNTNMNAEHTKLNYVNAGMWVMRLFTRVIERISFFYMPATMIVAAHTQGAFKPGSVRQLYTLVLAALLIGLFLYRMKAWNYSFCIL